jgi:hypothetical protein
VHVHVYVLVHVFIYCYCASHYPLHTRTVVAFLLDAFLYEYDRLTAQIEADEQENIATEAEELAREKKEEKAESDDDRQGRTLAESETNRELRLIGKTASWRRQVSMRLAEVTGDKNGSLRITRATTENTQIAKATIKEEDAKRINQSKFVKMTQ